MRLIHAGLLVLVAACAPSRIVLVAGTTLVDSGIVDAVIGRYEAETGQRVAVVGEPSAKALELLERGAADLALTHAPALEAAFAAARPEAAFVTVWASRFLLVGPPEAASALEGLSLEEALRTIRDRGLPFVSRGDESGTHEVELASWAMAGIDTADLASYVETGLGMGPTLQVADQRDGLTLTEEGAFRAASNLDLAVVSLAGTDLTNPYTAVTLRSPSSPAWELLTWLQSPQGGEALAEANTQIFGRTVYQPSRAASSQPAPSP